MSRKRNSLKYEMKRLAFQNTKNEMNNHTKTTYRRSINRFAEWAVGRGCRDVNDITKKLIQEYEIYLEESPKSYAPSTIHTYLAPICVAVGVSMEEIKKPKRKARYISRSRHFDYSVKKEGNQQGLAEEKNPKYARVVAFNRVVGIRRAELGKLYGSDLISRGDDKFILVKRGKGGKTQEQYILPQDVGVVLDVFSGVGPSEKVFSNQELNNKIDFHRMRAAHARRCYAYYAENIDADPAFADKMRNKLMNRWLEAHKRHREENYKSWERKKKRFELDMDSRPYKLRGDNLSKAIEADLPVEYNRLALMCVSVFHLSHWRLDVTVTNYLVY